MTTAAHKFGFTLATALLLLISPPTIHAQGLPQTEIWLASISDEIPGSVTRINPDTGYNNQPHFSVDGSVIFYTREMPNNNGGVQTDIAAYNIGSAATTMVNATGESEYSPTPIPGRNALSVIQADLEGKQLLWAIDIKSGEMELLLPGIEPVGYHAWFNDNSVAMFILGNTFTLQTATLGDDVARIAAENIGRTLRRHPQSGEVLFVDKNHEPWLIAAFDPGSGDSHIVMPLFPGNEDFTIDEKGNYWTGNDSRLYHRSPEDSRWNLKADFSAQGIRNITRLAINPAGDKIAIVSDHVGSD